MGHMEFDEPMEGWIFDVYDSETRHEASDGILHTH